MKKFISLLTALVLAVCIFPCGIFAENDLGSDYNADNTSSDNIGSLYYIFDPFGYINDSDLDSLYNMLEDFYKKTSIHISIGITDYIGEDKTSQGAESYAKSLGTALWYESDDYVVLLLNNDTGEDFIIGNGKGAYYSQEDFLGELELFWSDSRQQNDFYSTAMEFTAVAYSHADDANKWWQTADPDNNENGAASENQVNTQQESYKGDSEVDLTGSLIISKNKKAYILDESFHLTASQRDKLIIKAEDYTVHTGLNIVIAISDDVGPNKSDSAVVDYADLMYEKYCGINTNGVLLLINNDTYYDYISTSGTGINYYSDYRIEQIHESIYSYLKSEDYYSAASRFIYLAEHYYDSGKDNHQVEVFGSEFELESFFGVLFVVGIFCLVIGLIIYHSNANSYKLQKPNTSVYVVQGSKLFQQATDTFVGTITSRVYSPRSSGGSGGGHSGHSSTHHSSGGGRHGGGGHHR